MAKHIKAFSLVELMVVIAIVAILAAVATPTFKSYSARAKVVSGVHLLDVLKTKAIEYYNKNGSFPTQLTDVGYSGNSTIQSGIYGLLINPTDSTHKLRLYIDITSSGLNIAASGLMILSLTPSESNGVITFNPGHYLDDAALVTYVPAPYSNCAWLGNINAC